MAMFDGRLQRLDGLLALSKAEGVDIRPTLARVLTDLFLEGAVPSAEETLRYVELISHLLSHIDSSTRAVIAAKLSTCAHAPQSILDRLLADEPGIAAPILANSQKVSADQLWALLETGDPLMLSALASRADLDIDMIHALASRGDPEVAEVLAANERAPLDGLAVERLAAISTVRKAVADTLSRRGDIDASLLAPFALDMDVDQRSAFIESFLANPKNRIAGRHTPYQAPQIAFSRLEEHAIAGETDAFDALLASLLETDADRVEQLIARPDMLALALTALGMPGEQAIRVIMFACPGAGRSVTAIRDIDALLNNANRMAATRIIRAALGAVRAPAPAAHQPYLADTPHPVRREEGLGQGVGTEDRRQRAGEAG